MLHQGVQFMLWNHCFGLSGFSVMTVYVVLFREFLNKSNFEVMAAHRLSARNEPCLSTMSVPLSPAWGWCCWGQTASCLCCLCHSPRLPAVSLPATTSQPESERAASACPDFPENKKHAYSSASLYKRKMCLLLVWMCSNIDDLVPHWQIKPSWIID